MPDCLHIIQRINITDGDILPCAQCHPSPHLELDFGGRRFVLGKLPLATISLEDFVTVYRTFWWPIHANMIPNYDVRYMRVALEQRIREWEAHEMAGSNPISHYGDWQ